MLTRVQFVCAANAVRSQMAEALLRSLGRGDFEVHSAGIRPRDKGCAVARPLVATSPGPQAVPDAISAGLVQITTVPGGGPGVEVDLAGSARADAQPQQVFCDMEAMILGVTQAP